MSKFSKSATKMLILSTITIVGVTLIATWMGYVITRQGALYQEQLQLAASVAERDAAVQSLHQLVAQTAEERAAIESSFLDVVEIAVFLEQIERYASENQLLLESDQLQELPQEEDAQVAQVRIPYLVEGARNDVLDFVTLLESVPYHGSMERMEIQTARNNPDVVSATVVVVLSYRQYDRE